MISFGHPAGTGGSDAPCPPRLLARLDAALAELQAIPLTQLAALPGPAGEQIGPNLDRSPDDLLLEHLIEISTAVERFNRPADSLRWICRKQGCGVKVGGRWMASSPRPLR